MWGRHEFEDGGGDGPFWEGVFEQSLAGIETTVWRVVWPGMMKEALFRPLRCLR